MTENVQNTMQMINTASQQVASGSAREADKLTNHAREMAINGNNHMGDLVKAIGDISDSSKNIAKIIKTIDEIAFQTNILALNAAASTELLQEAVAKFRI